MKNTFLFLLISLIVIACSPWKKVYKKQYVKGKVVAKYQIKGKNYIYGVFLFDNHLEHDDSYYAFIRPDRIKISSNFDISKKCYALLEAVEGVTFVTELSNDPFDNMTEKREVITPFDLHIFENHGMSDKIHRRGHIIDMERINSNKFKYKLRVMLEDSTFNQKEVFVDSLNHNLIRSYQLSLPPNKTRPFFYENDLNNLDHIIDIDTCHQHTHSHPECTEVIFK